MNQLTISLPAEAQSYIDEQMASGTYTTVEELFMTLIEQAQERQAKLEVNALLRETIQEDKKIEATDEWWDQKREELIQQWRPKRI